MSVYAMIIWTIVAIDSGKPVYDWRPIASFRGESLCKLGAVKLNIEETRYRCVRLEN